MTSPFDALATSTGPTSARGPASFSENYERQLVGPLFRPWAEALLDRVSLARGARVLDVACGTGIVARLARGRVGEGGRVVGVDRNAEMLGVARSIEPAIDWREGDAAALPVREDERFDAVLCHQGLQFFPDRPAAVREMRRVLAPAGRVAIGVWRSLEENSVFHDLDLVAERFVGRVRDARHSFTDPDALAALLRDAGFASVNVEPVTMEIRFEDPAALARMNAMAAIGMSEKGKDMPPADRAELAAKLVEAGRPALERYAVGNAIVVRTAANLAVAE